MPHHYRPDTKTARECWYRELIIGFEDGTEERFYIELTQTGTHIPQPILEPASWVKLDHQKCPDCPLTSDFCRYCPAAESLESTLLRLKDHFSTEKVTARAIDGAHRETVVKQSLQSVGTALVQLAVFSSGCPIGKEFRPMLSDLRPFSTNRELSRHLVSKLLLKHRGEIDAVRSEMMDKLEPLREVFSHLCCRLPIDSKGDAMANSIISVDASTTSIALEIDEAVKELAQEMGWDRKKMLKARAQRKNGERKSFWSRIKALFSSND